MAGTWTYVRDGEKLEIQHVEHHDKAELIVQGLGETRRSEFTSLEALLIYVTTLESNLTTDGWILLRFHPERRSGQDRRATPRLGATDRRRPGAVLPIPIKRDPEE